MEREFDIEIKEVLSRVETVKAESLDICDPVLQFTGLHGKLYQIPAAGWR